MKKIIYGGAQGSLPPTQYFAGVKIKKNEVGGACGAYRVRGEVCTEF
jgi:hypothetical protein